MPPPAAFPHDRAADVLAALATMATATPGLDELAAELSLPLPSVAAELGKLERSGLIETWPDPVRLGSTRLMLSARSMARLGLRLSPRGDRWEPAGRPARPGSRPA